MCIVTGMVAGCIPGAIMWLVVCCCTPAIMGTTVTPGGSDCIPCGMGWPCTRCITGAPIGMGLVGPPCTGAGPTIGAGPGTVVGPGPSWASTAATGALTTGTGAAGGAGGGRCRAAAAAAAAAVARAAAASCDAADTDRACCGSAWAEVAALSSAPVSASLVDCCTVTWFPGAARGGGVPCRPDPAPERGSAGPRR